MVKGLMHHLREAWKKPARELTQDRKIEWRAGNSVVKVERPLRLDRARVLGYKAKKGVIVYRIRLKRGGRKRQRAGVKGRSTTCGLSRRYSRAMIGNRAMVTGRNICRLMESPETLGKFFK